MPPVDEDSESNPSDDANRDMLEATADNPTYRELVGALDALSDPERIEALALTWLGRGDYSKEEWLEALEKPVASTTKKTRIISSAPCYSLIIWRKGCRSWVTSSKISKSAKCIFLDQF